MISEAYNAAYVTDSLVHLIGDLVVLIMVVEVLWSGLTESWRLQGGGESSADALAAGSRL